MDQCRSESFYYRALPIGLAFGSLTQAGIASGKIVAVGTFGKFIRVFAAGTAGYVLGKASYANTCKQKFLEQAPNSNISRMLRGEQPLPPQEQPQQDYMVSMAPGTPQQQQQQQPFGQLSQPMGVQQQEEAIDRERREGTLSYDQLRNQHRQRHSQSQQMPAPPPPQPSQPAPPTNDPGFYTIPDPPVPSAPPVMSRGSGQSKNKYGDEGFE